ncbi:hypothetical protein [Lactobacillus sp. ESL0681]|uniref:hypothetical protein n=1 Tax=Lactobacillus sp. ESL0681 TaxID=2983211 RepID=UPI0023F90AE4|nr:hypothetical protein [Lactobacillus sp. ESL0681]WEV41286.1 hypothetical protein OZX59_09470 [Lactobacillus sp. ESL0681]
MHLTGTNELEQKIKNIDYTEVKAKIESAVDQDERDFWFSIYDRALQLRQKDIINKQEFVR